MQRDWVTLVSPWGSEVGGALGELMLEMGAERIG
jgi:hypothetical protein